MKSRILIGLFITALSSTLMFGQAPKFSNDFLNIGVGARAHGMSNAVIASSRDITAGYWNPAALSTIKAPFQVGVMHAEWFAGIGKYDYLAFGKSFNSEKQGFGALSVIRMGIDQIPNTLRLRDPDGNINYDAIEEFSVADYAFILSYAQLVGNKGLRVGGNTKIIHRTVGSFATAWGFGLDVSAQADIGRFTIGLMLRDITSTFNAWAFSFTDEEKLVLTQTNNDIPEKSIESTLPSAQLGVAHNMKFGEKFTLLTELDLEFSTNGRESAIIGGNKFIIDPRFGLELGYKTFAWLRGGVGNVQQVVNDVDGLSTDLIFQPTMGLGLKLGRIYLDYAFTDIGDVSIVESSHVISLTLDFVKKDL